jgi:enoyl-CoA hydratase
MKQATVPDEPVIRTLREGPIFIIQLNRPKQRNAINEALARAIHAAIDELDEDAALRVGVITGNESAFCSGMDLKAYLDNENPVTARGFAGLTRKPPVKPLIAAVEGLALAGGLEIALSCDLIVAARGAVFGVPEPKRGLVAAAGGLFRLPKRIAYHVAMYMAVTGESISADRAYEVGLVNKLVEPGTALQEALALAHLVAANAPLAVAASKAIVRGALDVDEQGGWSLQDRIGLPVLATEDAKEGAMAFAQKRAPIWQGR